MISTIIIKKKLYLEQQNLLMNASLFRSITSSTMRILQINSVANSGSTGRIAEELGNVLLDHGHYSYIAYGRGNATSSSHFIKIGSDKDVYFHGAYTLMTDKHGFASISATQKFIYKLVW